MIRSENADHPTKRVNYLLKIATRIFLAGLFLYYTMYDDTISAILKSQQHYKVKLGICVFLFLIWHVLSYISASQGKTNPDAQLQSKLSDIAMLLTILSFLTVKGKLLEVFIVSFYVMYDFSYNS